MENRNRIDLKIIPINGVDKDVSCRNCPSACCRKGMVIPLSGHEAELLVQAGTTLEEHHISRRERRRLGIGKETLYRFQSDCGNLATTEDGASYCKAFDQESPIRPSICSEFKEGGYDCGAIQLARIAWGQDTLAVHEE